jgi:hypothetical protein
MATVEGHRVVMVDGDLLWMVYADEGRCKPGCVEDFAPALDDPATLGCLLALVREVYGDPALYVRLSDTRRASDGVRAWEVLGWLDSAHSPEGRGGSWRGWGYASEAEALVAALEGAPIEPDDYAGTNSSS